MHRRSWIFVCLAVGTNHETGFAQQRGGMVTSEILWIGPIHPRRLDPILLLDRVIR